MKRISSSLVFFGAHLCFIAVSAAMWSASVAQAAGGSSASITIDSPVSGQTFAAPATIPITATAIDPEGYISRVEFYAEGKSIGVSELFFFRAPDPGTPIMHSLNWTNVRAGTYNITAQSTNAVGSRVSSPPTFIRVVDPRPIAPGSYGPIGPVAIPTFTIGRALTNKLNLPANYPLISQTFQDGVILWVLNPSPTNWVVETSTDFVNWDGNRALFNSYTNVSVIELSIGAGPATNGTLFYRARLSPNLYDAPLKKWRAAGITNYTFDYNLGCFCRSSVHGTVTVRNGKSVSVTNAANVNIIGPPQPIPSDDVSQFPSIDQLFESLKSTGENVFLDVTFDPRMSFPSNIVVGNPKFDAGEERTVSNFRPDPN